MRYLNKNWNAGMHNKTYKSDMKKLKIPHKVMRRICYDPLLIVMIIIKRNQYPNSVE